MAIPDLDECFNNDIVSSKLLENIIIWIFKNYEKEFFCKEDVGMISLDILLKSLKKVTRDRLISVRENGVVNLLTNLSTYHPFKEIAEEIIQFIVLQENNFEEVKFYTKNIKAKAETVSINNPMNSIKTNDLYMENSKREPISDTKSTRIDNAGNLSQDNKKSSSNNTIQANIVRKDEFSFNSLLQNFNSFTHVLLNNIDEQYIFDLNITLKFGDPSQVSKTCNIILNQVLNDFPLEYFLQNGDLIKVKFK